MADQLHGTVTAAGGQQRLLRRQQGGRGGRLGIHDGCDAACNAQPM